MRQDQRKEKLKKTHDVQLNDLVKHVQNVSFLLLLYTVFMSLFFFHGLFRSPDTTITKGYSTKQGFWPLFGTFIKSLIVLF